MKQSAAIIILCTLLLGLAACGGEMPSNTEPTPQISADNAENADGSPESEFDLSKAMSIETENATLYYPEEWENVVECEAEGEDDSSVEFYATVGHHERVHIFDVLFGGENGYCIGTIEKDGKEIEVNIVSYDVSFDGSWTEEEINTVRTMQEDVNFLIQALNAK